LLKLKHTSHDFIETKTCPSCEFLCSLRTAAGLRPKKCGAGRERARFVGCRFRQPCQIRLFVASVSCLRVCNYNNRIKTT